MMSRRLYPARKQVGFSSKGRTYEKTSFESWSWTFFDR
jgi:hypothetical protein